MSDRFNVYAPASTSNLGPGFDSLGMALELYLRVEVDRDAGFSLSVSGEGKGILPEDGRNRIVKAAREIAGNAVDQTAWRIHSEIPVARGLGSSAAARVAGLAAGHLLASGQLPPLTTLFDGVAQTENHPDNAAACVFGGFRISSRVQTANGHHWDTTEGLFEGAGVRLLLVIPEAPVSTQQARSILPSSYARSASVRNLQSLGTLLSGLARGDWPTVRRGCTDQLHEPYRLNLVPGLADALTTLRQHPSCGGAYLSGAGPILAAFVPDPNVDADAIGREAVQQLQNAGSAATCRITCMEPRGVRWQAC